jgi:hypothetical protein
MTDDPERLRRWQLVLGGDAADGIGVALDQRDGTIDGCLAALCDGPPEPRDRRGGLGPSSPNVSRWLGDIRSFFPTSVVRVMQQDAMERLNLRRLLLGPEMLATLEPDVHLLADLLSRAGVMPAKTKETARIVVRRCEEDIEPRLAEPMRAAVVGALNRSVRNRRPRHREIHWNRTIRANLKDYQPEYQTIVPESRIGYGRKRSALRDIVLCVDQSGGMATSVDYSGIFGAVLAKLPTAAGRSRVDA